MGKGTEPKNRKTDRRTLYTKNVIKDALLEALEDKKMAEEDCENPDDDVLQVLSLLAGEQPDHLKEKESLLPVCHRVAQLPKYQVIFHDETISNYVVNRIFQCQRKKLASVFMKVLNLSKKEAELLTLFIITGTYNVNKALNWKKNDTWYKVHSMLFRFMSGGFERLGEQNKKEEDGF